MSHATLPTWTTASTTASTPGPGPRRRRGCEASTSSRRAAVGEVCTLARALPEVRAKHIQTWFGPQGEVAGSLRLSQSVTVCRQRPAASVASQLTKPGPAAVKECEFLQPCTRIGHHSAPCAFSEIGHDDVRTWFGPWSDASDCQGGFSAPSREVATTSDRIGPPCRISVESVHTASCGTAAKIRVGLQRQALSGAHDGQRITNSNARVTLHRPIVADSLWHSVREGAQSAATPQEAYEVSGLAQVGSCSNLIHNMLVQPLTGHHQQSEPGATVMMDADGVETWRWPQAVVLDREACRPGQPPNTEPRVRSPLEMPPRRPSDDALVSETDHFREWLFPAHIGTTNPISDAVMVCQSSSVRKPHRKSSLYRTAEGSNDVKLYGRNGSVKKPRRNSTFGRPAVAVDRADVTALRPLCNAALLRRNSSTKNARRKVTFAKDFDVEDVHIFPQVGAEHTHTHTIVARPDALAVSPHLPGATQNVPSMPLPSPSGPIAPSVPSHMSVSPAVAATVSPPSTVHTEFKVIEVDIDMPPLAPPVEPDHSAFYRGQGAWRRPDGSLLPPRPPSSALLAHEGPLHQPAKIIDSTPHLRLHTLVTVKTHTVLPPASDVSARFGDSMSVPSPTAHHHLHGSIPAPYAAASAPPPPSQPTLAQVEQPPMHVAAQPSPLRHFGTQPHQPPGVQPASTSTGTSLASFPGPAMVPCVEQGIFFGGVSTLTIELIQMSLAARDGQAAMSWNTSGSRLATAAARGAAVGAVGGGLAFLYGPLAPTVLFVGYGVGRECSDQASLWYRDSVPATDAIRCSTGSLSGALAGVSAAWGGATLMAGCSGVAIAMAAGCCGFAGSIVGRRLVDCLFHGHPTEDEQRLHAAYAALGVSPSCSNADLRRAFCRAALAWRPDRTGPGVPGSHENFARVSDALDQIWGARGHKAMRKRHHAWPLDLSGRQEYPASVVPATGRNSIGNFRCMNNPQGGN